MQIHELNTFSGELNEGVYLAVDNGADTTKIPVTEVVRDADNAKLNTPTDIYDQPTYGTAGQILRTKGNGVTEWANVGQPTDAQTAQAVSDWLDAHPEATTTVEDNSLTNKKLVLGTLDFVTPEMFGAVGDGVTDDSQALQAALDYAVQNNQAFIASGKYYFTTGLFIRGLRETIDGQRVILYGEGINIDFSAAKLTYGGSDFAITVTMINGGYINVGRIFAENGGGVYLHSASLLNFIDYLTLDGVEIKASASKDGIYVLNEGKGWNNQNVIKTIRFTGGSYGIHIKNDGQNKINEWEIDNVGFEGVANGIYLEAITESDNGQYIGYITVHRPRCIELIGTTGGKLLTTYGRVMDVVIDVSYLGASALSENAFSFNYDSSGSTTYAHGTSNIRVYSATKQLVINNNKIQQNPYAFASACNIEAITSVQSEAETVYKNYFGTLAEFASAIGSLSTAQLTTSRYANLNNLWLGGQPTDQAASKQILQKLTTQDGVEFVRSVRNGNLQSDWLMTPLIKTEQKVLHGNTFTFPFNAIGLLFIFPINGRGLTIYTVRFGTATEPLKIFSTDSEDWTIAKVSGHNDTISFSRASTSTTTYNVSFVNLV